MADDNKDIPATLPARTLALDVGSKRIGLAVTDALGITAQPLPTLERRNLRADMAALRRAVRKNGATEIVVGYPLRMSGEAGTQAQKVEKLAELLRAETGLPVHLV